MMGFCVWVVGMEGGFCFNWNFLMTALYGSELYSLVKYSLVKFFGRHVARDIG